jgi:Helix-turn-helix domain
MNLEQRLDRIEAILVKLTNRQTVNEWYSVEEFARIVGRSVLTCRYWCRMGRIQARKKGSGRGAHAAWAIAHEELQRYQKEGLLQGQ